MQSFGLKYDLPKRVLFLLLLLWGVLTIFLGVKLGFGGAILSIVIIPLALLFIKYPLSLVAAGIFGSTNFYRILISLAQIETAYVLYSLFTISIIGGCLVLYVKQPNKKYVMSSSEILLIVISFIVLFGLIKSKDLEYGTLKAGQMFITVLIPFIFLQIFRYNLDKIETLFKLGIVFMIPATAGSIINLLIGGVSHWQRMTLAGAGPVGFASGMGVAVLLGLLVFECSTTIVDKGLVLLFTLSSLLALVTAATRGPVISIVLAYLIHIVLFSRLTWKKRILVLSLLVITGAFFATRVSTFLLYRTAALQGVEMSHAGRMLLWKTSIEHLFDAPIFGLGTGSFGSILSASGKSTGLHYPHNIFLEYYIEFGLVGLSIFLAFLLSIAIKVYKALKNPTISKLQKNMLQICITLTLYALSGSMISFDITSKFVYQFAALTLAMTYIKENHASLNARIDAPA